MSSVALIPRCATRYVLHTLDHPNPLPHFRPARMALPCRLPSGEDGRGRENRKSMPWRGPAGVSPPPGGVYLRFREREGEALGVPTQGSRQRSAQTTVPLQRCEAAGRPVGADSATAGVVQ